MFFVSVTVDYLYTARFFHVDGTKSSSSGQSSSLPASMSKVSTNFEKLLSGVKLAVGPNAWNPGPILKMQAKTANAQVVGKYIAMKKRQQRHFVNIKNAEIFI